jgi:hypothetical protein
MRRELGDDLGVIATSEGSVQVNQMDPFGTGVLPALGCCTWVAEALLRAGTALDQLHRLTTGDVNRRQQNKPVGATCGL